MLKIAKILSENLSKYLIFSSSHKHNKFKQILSHILRTHELHHFLLTIYSKAGLVGETGGVFFLVVGDEFLHLFQGLAAHQLDAVQGELDIGKTPVGLEALFVHKVRNVFIYNHFHAISRKAGTSLEREAM